uniref:Uncharacterized protein n=1 Tax=Panagrolaimus sp. ES5 TaxID=591445 RepID=A0AC34F1B8_9BILA
MIEFAVFFAGIVGPQVAEKNVQDQISIINRYITYLEKCKPFLSSRIKFCIMKLADLRDNKWKTNGNEQKWMDIIIRDFIFEEMQNDSGTFIFQRVKNSQSDEKISEKSVFVTFAVQYVRD